MRTATITSVPHGSESELDRRSTSAGVRYNRSFFDYNYDRGYNNFDVRHLFNLSLLYELPFGRGKRWLGNLGGASQAVLGGWQVGGIYGARSGLPIDVKIVRPDIVWVDASGKVFNSAAPGRTAVVNTLGGGASRNVRRPDLVSGVNPFVSSGGTLFLNPAAFATPAPGKFGNIMRGALHGPDFQQVDFTVSKSFRFTEMTRLEFRTEMFNVMNRTNFANPPAILPNALSATFQPGQPFTAATAGTFGQMNSTVSKTVGLGTNRQIQFGLRLSF